MFKKNKPPDYFQAVLVEICVQLRDDVSFDNYLPDDVEDFFVQLEVWVTFEDDSRSRERFDVGVCSVSCVEKQLEINPVFGGHGLIILNKYSPTLVSNYIKKHISWCRGKTVDDVMRRVGLLGEWEYEWEGAEGPAK